MSDKSVPSMTTDATAEAEKPSKADATPAAGAAGGC